MISRQRSEQEQEPDSTTLGYPDDIEAASSTSPSRPISLITRSSTNGSGSILNGNHAAMDLHDYHQTQELLNQLESLDDLNRLIEAAGGLEGDDYELPRSLIVTNLDSRCFQEGTLERVI
jgi:hypothetical protein